MGLFKRCRHRGRARDRCDDAWWGSFRGKRVSLSKWANQDIRSRDEAQAVLDEVRTAIRQGTFNPKGQHVEDPVEQLTFGKFAEVYWTRHVQLRGLKSADTTRYRLDILKGRFGDRLLREITTSDLEDFLNDLRKEVLRRTGQVRRPASVNRWRALLVGMFGFAVARDHLIQSPFRKGGTTLIPMLREDNKRDRRVSPGEEQRLLNVGTPTLRLLIRAALYSGTRRGEMLALTWADVDARPGWIRLRGDTTKSAKTRWVPVHPHVQAVFDFLRTDAAGDEKPAGAAVFSTEAGEPIGDFNRDWEDARLEAHGLTPVREKRTGKLTPESRAELRRINLRWHDLRHEFASRLAERGVPLTEVKDLLGHASVVTTERYATAQAERLAAAVQTLAQPDPAPKKGNASVSHSLHTPSDEATVPATDRQVS